MAFLWFSGYDIDELPPDHSILSKARKRLGKEVFEGFFKKVVQICDEEGLIEGRRIYVDSTLLKANASLDSLVSKSLYLELPDAKEYVDRLFSEDDIDHLKANERRISKTDPDSSVVYHV